MFSHGVIRIYLSIRMQTKICFFSVLQSEKYALKWYNYVLGR